MLARWDIYIYVEKKSSVEKSKGKSKSKKTERCCECKARNMPSSYYTN